MASGRLFAQLIGKLSRDKRRRLRAFAREGVADDVREVNLLGCLRVGGFRTAQPPAFSRELVECVYLLGHSASLIADR